MPPRVIPPLNLDQVQYVHTAGLSWIYMIVLPIFLLQAVAKLGFLLVDLRTAASSFMVDSAGLLPLLHFLQLFSDRAPTVLPRSTMLVQPPFCEIIESHSFFPQRLLFVNSDVSTDLLVQSLVEKSMLDSGMTSFVLDLPESKIFIGRCAQVSSN